MASRKSKSSSSDVTTESGVNKKNAPEVSESKSRAGEKSQPTREKQKGFDQTSSSASRSDVEPADDLDDIDSDR